MAEWQIVPSWLHEPSGGATFDDPSICYQRPDPLTGKPKVSNLPVSGRRLSASYQKASGPSSAHVELGIVNLDSCELTFLSSGAKFGQACTNHHTYRANWQYPKTR